MRKWDEGVDGFEKGEEQSERYWAIDVEEQLEQGLPLRILEKTAGVAYDLLIFERGGWEKESWI